MSLHDTKIELLLWGGPICGIFTFGCSPRRYQGGGGRARGVSSFGMFARLSSCQLFTNLNNYLILYLTLTLLFSSDY